eukprot:CAMPEP_0197631662 /NCGR_PEP_ID=MMETSP1338-20131121/8753_1 /TAXON_ID=43686 ORGANISM="Pelagodinium beii, Strain RCC1491" /NCGR_SAMPLE_ID=MMETSP1338 /ASSEMBLY_ACC=CAM_ASM_000754 /LENGTH=806 /DNA_ID=CAMNT_0043203173 /DNA_START=41 /DNA_END=2458 /DNA_ORIENTATION=+
MSARFCLHLILAAAVAQELSELVEDDECSNGQCALNALQLRSLQEIAQDGEADLASEDEVMGCCGPCGGHGYCSPKSGRCYPKKWAVYFQNCQVSAQHGECCNSGCTGFCSPVSGRCYPVKYRGYFKTCSAPVSPSVPAAPAVAAAPAAPAVPESSSKSLPANFVHGRPWSQKASTIKGVCYGPVPLKSPHGGSQLHEDDWMALAAKPMWGDRGRADLKVISALGANFVRLYGNDPNNGHTEFLEAAHKNGLQVAPGMSDHPYTQMAGNCKQTGYDCYSQVKELYLQNLLGVNCTYCGFLTTNKTYSPAVSYFSIINEPDLKMPPTATIRGFDGIAQMCKAIVSAFDAILDAEKEAEVQGPGINFTATFSFAVCKPCAWFKRNPALGQMAQLQDAMMNPQKYGYTPKNNLGEAYRTRWTNSFNTQNKAGDLQNMILAPYETWFRSTPVYIAEYHSTYVSEASDVKQILDIARASNVLLGISYFQFQRAYWKGGTEEAFGMFGLGDYSITDMDYFDQTYKVWCLVPQWSSRAETTQTAAVARAYDGSYFNTTELCMPNPMSVPVSADGYKLMSQQGSIDRMASFVTRVVNHLGAVVVDKSGLESFTTEIIGDSSSDFGKLVEQIFYKPGWLRFSQSGRCLADRNSDNTHISAAINYVCGANETLFNCSNLQVPKTCNSDIFATGDWFFSNFYMNMTAADPLQTCSLGGAGIYASPNLYQRVKPECIADSSPFQAAIALEQAPVQPVHTLGQATWDWKPSSSQETKKATGPSCALYGCINVYAPANKCQCNPGCDLHGSCCSDYKSMC